MSVLYLCSGLISWFLLNCSPIKAQEDVIVMCSEPGSTDCSNSNAGNIPLLMVTYASCCTTVNAVNRYYVDIEGDGVCRRCGPILNRNLTLPTESSSSIVVFSWALSASSVIPVLEFSVGAKVENELVFFPNTFAGDIFSAVFSQEEGVRYIYRVRARSEAGGVSPPVDVSWVTGASLAPLLGDFSIVSINNTEVTITWLLDFNGVRPMEQIVLVLTIPPSNEPVDNRTLCFDQPQPDGTRFEVTFAIQGVQQYVLQVNASNSEHTMSTFYVVGDTIEVSTFSPDVGGLNSAAHLDILHGLCLFVLLVLYYILM